MPTSGRTGAVLVDTSVAVALCVVSHAHHETTSGAVGDRPLGLAGHAAFETFSVLTRLPAPVRRTPATVARMLAVNFPETRMLSAEGADTLLQRLARGELAGGSVYDALVASAAGEHRMTLLSRDRRALETYRIFGVDVELIAVE